MDRGRTEFDEWQGCVITFTVNPPWLKQERCHHPPSAGLHLRAALTSMLPISDRMSSRSTSRHDFEVFCCFVSCSNTPSHHLQFPSSLVSGFHKQNEELQYCAQKLENRLDLINNFQNGASPLSFFPKER